MTYIVSDGALNSTHSLSGCQCGFAVGAVVDAGVDKNREKRRAGRTTDTSSNCRRKRGHWTDPISRH